MTVESHAVVNPAGHTRIWNGGKPIMTHRFVYEKMKTKLKKKEVVRHTCDNPRCVNPMHLIKGSQRDNIWDQILRNRNVSGDRHGMAKFTNEQVLAMRAEHKSMTDMGFENCEIINEISEKYLCAKDTLRKIISGQSYKHVTEENPNGEYREENFNYQTGEFDER